MISGGGKLERLMKYALLLIITAVFSTALPVFAGDPPPANNREPASNRSKNIKFEDDVVEGMNKNPMDSAENLGRHDGGSNNHLYHKPTDFKDAVRQTVHEMGKTQ